MWRPRDGFALAVATRLGVKLGTVVAMRLRSNALKIGAVSKQDTLLTVPERMSPVRPWILKQLR